MKIGLATEKDVEQLLREVERYLVAVEVFRAEGREPAWWAEAPLPPCA